MELYLCHHLERAIICSELYVLNFTSWNFEHVFFYFASTSIIFEKEITLEQTKIDSVLHKCVCILVFIVMFSHKPFPWCTNSPLGSLTSPYPPPPTPLNLSSSPHAQPDTRVIINAFSICWTQTNNFLCGVNLPHFSLALLLNFVCFRICVCLYIFAHPYFLWLQHFSLVAFFCCVSFRCFCFCIVPVFAGPLLFCNAYCPCRPP